MGCSQEHPSAPAKSNTKSVQDSSPVTATTATPSNDIKDSKSHLYEVAKHAIKKYKISALKSDCLILDILPEQINNRDVVDIREKHDVTCGGDPGTSPRLFSLQIDSKTGEVWSDANSLTAEFEKLEK